MKVFDINETAQLALVADEGHLHVRYVPLTDIAGIEVEPRSLSLLKQMHLIANNPAPSGLLTPATKPLANGWLYGVDDPLTGKKIKI